MVKALIWGNVIAGLSTLILGGLICVGAYLLFIAGHSWTMTYTLVLIGGIVQWVVLHALAILYFVKNRNQ